MFIWQKISERNANVFPTQPNMHQVETEAVFEALQDKTVEVMRLQVCKGFRRDLHGKCCKTRTK